MSLKTYSKKKRAREAQVTLSWPSRRINKQPLAAYFVLRRENKHDSGAKIAKDSL